MRLLGGRSVLPGRSHDLVRTVVRGIVRDRVADHHVPCRRHARLYVYMADQSFSVDSPEEAGTPPSVRPLLVSVLQAGEILCLSRSSIYQLGTRTPDIFLVREAL